VDHGFQVVLVNTRGCAGFGRAWRESTLSNLGFTELEDLRQVRAALVAAGRVEADRTLLMGGSWGGYMTLLGLGTQPELWKAGVALVPVGDFPGAHLEATPLIRAVNRTQFGGGMDTHASVYHKASPLTYVDGIKAPILMLAGKYDLLCPPQQNIRFAEAVRARGGECELHLSEGAHGTTNREERIRHWTLILEFLMRHCRASDAQNRA
jgi:dipeptidyl aminopeptidase/acylaminoacyl peptidase